ncbi:hypothetical protein [Massilia soli]|uniref:Cobalt transporter n=1 Tax=Massilia soli TaxID=2792854 RepID=A0ABS7SV33_9BURK|nr:hypothetical protein [Massilia soli]MBZ2209780.1 hypothetical protein [Massilia soli]
MRRLICLLLLMCLPLQSFALQAGSFVFGADVNLAHEIAHEEQIQHHHHDNDDSVHYDDSDESAQHTLDHSNCQQPAGVWISKQPPSPDQLGSITAPEFSCFIPDPYLDSPLRPPVLALG